MEYVASQPAPCEIQVQDSAPCGWIVKAEAAGRYVRIRDWTSKFLPTPRDLFIYLPEAYFTQPDRAFPLLVMHDGQNLFDGGLSYVKDSTWRVGSTADEEIAAGRAEPLVILGVANTGAQRMAEYTPTADRRLSGGKGRLYARLLVEELLPMMTAAYRILPGPEHTGVAGSSLGGLISLAIGLHFPNVFGLIGVLSPSIWWDDRAILKDVRSLTDQPPLRIWLDIGAAEGMRHLRDADLLAHLLEGKGWREGLDLLYRRVPGGLHNEAAWAGRFGEVLRFLFPSS
jgi:predicted alpha/beta superfamily hydrolase